MSVMILSWTPYYGHPPTSKARYESYTFEVTPKGMGFIVRVFVDGVHEATVVRGSEGDARYFCGKLCESLTNRHGE